jgi:hypothetical protein
MGPYWWLCHQVRIPEPVRDGIDVLYEPIWRARWNGPKCMQEAIHRYLHWWTVDLPPQAGRGQNEVTLF